MLDENNNELIDSINDTSELDDNTALDNQDDLSEVEKLKQQLAQKEELNKKLFERAKKAEQRLKIKPTTTSDPNDKDELKLIARGLSDEDIDIAKKIAKGADTSLLEALKDPLFIAYQERKKEEQRKEQAKLGASNSSNFHQDTGISSGMSRDEHKEVWKKMVK